MEATAELNLVLSVQLLILIEQTLLLKNLVLHHFEFEGQIEVNKWLLCVEEKHETGSES